MGARSRRTAFANWAGHYGLPGLQERARPIGGKVTVWSESGSGTEIESTVPASVVYVSPGGPRPLSGARSLPELAKMAQSANRKLSSVLAVNRVSLTQQKGEQMAGNFSERVINSDLSQAAIVAE